MTNLPDVIALGETMRSVVTVAGLSGELPTELVTHGGAESNTCVALARLGFGAAWVSRLGTDDAGDQVLEELRARGVDLRWVGGIMYKNSEIEETGVAAGVLGHPALGVAWLANKLGSHGVALEPGHLVLAGSFTRVVFAHKGDTLHADFGPLGGIAVQFV